MTKALSRRGFIAASGAAFLCAPKAIAGSTAFNYDALGRLITALYPDAALAVYEYDAAGNRTVVKNPFIGSWVTPDCFDPEYYVRAYQDVAASGMDSYAHFLQYGWREGRNPNSFFSTTGYLEAYPDVARAGQNPLIHYANHGWLERRDPSTQFDTDMYLEHNQGVKEAGMNPLFHYLVWGANEGRAPQGNGTFRLYGHYVGPGINVNCFDPAYYLRAYHDVFAAGADPYGHYLDFGWRQGRNPNAFFNTSGYLAAYPDVANAGMDPLFHYAAHGWMERRDPSEWFDTKLYIENNPDVQASNLNPLYHYLTIGFAEGRSPQGDGGFR